MKRNIYSKLWVIFFVLMGAACTNQVEDAIPVSGQPIGFSVQSDWKEIHNSRSNDKTQFVGGDEIQIFGFHKPSKDAVENVQFMYQKGDQTTGQKVKFDGTNWIYTPKRFWPKAGVLDFFASYPCYPYKSIHYDVEKKWMTYENNLTQDLLYGLATDRDCASKDNNEVPIWMVHALAKVKIILDSSLGDIGQVTVSGYKAGHFSPMSNNDGVPVWEIDDDKPPIYADFKYDEIHKNNSVTVTVFILPEKITGLWMFGVSHGNGNEDVKKIDASNEIQKYTFKAGKVYNLTISKSNGVRKKNTNSRSIAMSVRCVSE